MTNAPETELALPPAQVEELLTLVSKGLRAIQLYLPNNPVYQRAVDNVRVALRKIWESTDDLVFDVGETELRWEGNVVYLNDQKNESIAWALFKDGIRSLTLKRGVEETEIVRFLQVLHQARLLQADAADDLLTLLWQEDFQTLTYTFRELAAENAVPIEKDEEVPEVSATDVRQAVQEEAPPPRPAGVVSMDDFDTTLYFLEDSEITYLQAEVEREYSQDLRRNVLGMLFDLLELQTFGTVRAELISIVENFIPYLLGAGDFRSVAYILRETRVLLQRARELIPEHRTALESIPSRLSQSEALAQLLQSLDEAMVHPTEEELGELFAELRPEALATLASWVGRLSNERVRELVLKSAEKLAVANAPEVLRALAAPDRATQLEMVRLAGRLKLPGAPDGMGPLLETDDREVKLAVTEALVAIATPSALRLLERAVEDPERDVRIAAVRFLGQRGHRGAFQRIEAAVTGNKLRSADLTEKMTFFEAYGTLAGPSGISILSRMLGAKGILRREDPETRACAAMALGRIKSADARAILESNTQDKEPLVRNAVNRALREASP